MKKSYQKPAIRVVEFQAEQGFAASGFSPVQNETVANTFNFVMNFGDNTPRNEQYQFEEEEDFWN